jgi:hypothetical protein
MGFAIVEADIAHDFAIQIFDRSKDAASNEIALDFREPNFDLIEPRRIGRRVMNAYFRVTSQKIADRLGFMCAQVIADDVNGSLCVILRAGMTLFFATLGNYIALLFACYFAGICRGTTSEAYD